MVVQPLQNAVVAQPQEPAVDCLPRREAVGQEPPGATGSEHEKIAFTISLIGHALGRPVRHGAGKCGSNRAHSSSLTSLA
jgi:hypothetical protein